MSGITPQFMAQVTLYRTEAGGRKQPIVGAHFGCPCKFDEKDYTAWDCRILLNGETLAPGETKQFGVTFLTPEAGALFSKVNKFYLWEGRIIGESTAKI